MNQGKQVILVRRETVPDDIHGMFVAQGILTATGGMTSHAAVVGRQMGKPSVVGAGELEINEAAKQFKVKGQTVKEGDFISFDGLSGEVKLGRVASKPSEILQVVNGTLDPKKSELYRRFNQLLTWSDKFRRMGIRANADLPDQAELAYAFGARGIGLCRTEHMFFGEGRIPIVQKMILADNEKDRRKALDELLPMQRDDFYGVFKAMHGEAVTIRTIDPPLHEFLPKREDLMVDIARLEADRQVGPRARREEDACWRASSSSTSSTRCSATAASVSALPIRKSPKCRRGRSSRPRAGWRRKGVKVVPEIMIPLVGLVKELRDQKAIVNRVAGETMKAQGVKIKYLVGTMIEVPRGAMTADQIAEEAAVLLVRDERPDAADVRIFARRRREVSADLSGQEDSRARSVRVDRHRRRRRDRPDGRAARPEDAPRSEDRRLRRAWRRSVVDPLLREASASITSARRLIESRWHGSPRHRRRSSVKVGD